MTGVVEHIVLYSSSLESVPLCTVGCVLPGLRADDKESQNERISLVG